jgi:hypothetical protein
MAKVTKEELQTYLKVRREFLKEDGYYYVGMFLQDYPGVSHLIDEVDYDELVEDFEDNREASIAEEDTWEEVVADYFYRVYDLN